MATHSRILAWRIPWAEERGKLQSIGLQRVGHNWSDTTHTRAFQKQEMKHLTALWQKGSENVWWARRSLARLNQCPRSLPFVSRHLGHFHVHVCSAVSDSFRPRGLQPTRFLCPWSSPDKSPGWVAISYSKGAFRPIDWTHVSCISCIGRQIIYHCAIYLTGNNAAVNMGVQIPLWDPVFISLEYMCTDVGVCENSTSFIFSLWIMPVKKIFLRLKARVLVFTFDLDFSLYFMSVRLSKGFLFN